MTQLAKDSGIELKPFCVRTEDFTEREIADLLDRSVDLGAQAEEAYAESVTRHKFPNKRYVYGYFTYTGVHCDLVTWFENFPQYYGNNLLSREEALTYLHLEAREGRLVVIEEVLPTIKLSLEEAGKDAQDWGVVLNSCGWLANDIWCKHFGETTTPTQFNNLKGLLREVIGKYLEEVYKDTTEKEKLDKEIEEAENKLNELKSKRGG